MNVARPRYGDIFEDEEKTELACIFWASVVDHLKENELLSCVRLKLADRYVRALVQYDFLSPTALSEGPVKRGPNGGDVFNFNWSAVEKLDDRLAKFEAALLIDPKSMGLRLVEKKPEEKRTAADEFLDG